MRLSGGALGRDWQWRVGTNGEGGERIAVGLFLETCAKHVIGVQMKCVLPLN